MMAKKYLWETQMGKKKIMQKRSIKTGQKMSAQGKILGFQVTNISLLKHLTEKIISYPYNIKKYLILVLKYSSKTDLTLI